MLTGIVSGNQEPIERQVNKKIQNQALENRKRLIPIVETVLLCGRQGLALRGHRDSGPITLEEPLENDGNFRAILRHCGRINDETKNCFA